MSCWIKVLMRVSIVVLLLLFPMLASAITRYNKKREERGEGGRRLINNLTGVGSLAVETRSQS